MRVGDLSRRRTEASINTMVVTFFIDESITATIGHIPQDTVLHTLIGGSSNDVALGPGVATVQFTHSTNILEE